VYALSNTSAGRDGSIYFQYPSYYSALQTSFATTQAADITVTNNTWTGTNTFNNTTNLNTTIIQGTGTIQFPDLSIQSTAYKSLPSGIYTNSNITVDANGGISAISTGVGGANAQTIDLTLTGAGSSYYIPFSSTTGATSTLRVGGLTYNRDTNTLTANCTNTQNIQSGVAGQLLYQSASTTTGFVAVGTSNQVLVSNGSSAPSWSTNLAGNAGSSTAVALTSDDSAGDYFIPFSKTTSATSNPLYIDNTTGPLSYRPSTGVLSALSYTFGLRDQTVGGNSSRVGQTATALEYVNNATSGTHKFYTYNSTPAQVNSMTIGSTAISTVVPVNVVTTIVGNLPSMTIKQSTSSQIINFTPFAPLGTSNPITNADSSVLSCGGGGTSRRLVLTTDSATTVGIRMSNVAIVIGAGGTANNPLHRIGFSDSAGINISSSFVPIVEGYTLPAGGDNSTNIATTAWVQTAIPLGTSLLATNIKSTDIGLNYQSAANTTTRLTNGTLGYILTSTGSSAPTWQANSGGSAYSAQRVALTPIAAGYGYSIPFSSSATGSAEELKTSTNLTYNNGTNVLSCNINGSANSATSAGLATQVTLTQSAASSGPFYMVLSSTASGTSSLLTDTSGGSYDSANNILDVNVTANSGSTTATAITNDTASSSFHAITFTSNTTGYLPQKTRANVSTGMGLTYIPSLNTLNVNASGTGSIITANLILKDNLNNEASISQASGNLTIESDKISSSILLQTADAGGLVNTRVNISDPKTEIVNKLQTQAGIIGPGLVLTYANNMIGYTNGKTAGNGTVTTVTTATWSAMTATGFQFPSVGVYMMTMQIFCNKSAAAGNLLYLSAGMSTTDINAQPSGQGSFGLVLVSTSSQPAVTGFLTALTTMPMVITNTATVYYMMFNAGFTGCVYTRIYANSFYQYTRIA
jgi:hypothetical protein